MSAIRCKDEYICSNFISVDSDGVLKTSGNVCTPEGCGPNSDVGGFCPLNYPSFETSFLGDTNYSMVETFHDPAQHVCVLVAYDHKDDNYWIDIAPEKVCPDSYAWDVAQQTCLPVCRPPWQYDASVGKCTCPQEYQKNDGTCAGAPPPPNPPNQPDVPGGGVEPFVPTSSTNSSIELEAGVALLAVGAFLFLFRVLK